MIKKIKEKIKLAKVYKKTAPLKYKGEGLIS